MSADASGATTLTQLSDFDFANRGCALVHHGARWAAGDAFISMLMVDCRGTTPLLEIVRFPVDNLGVIRVDETTVEVVMAVPIAFPGDDTYLDHAWSPDGSRFVYHDLGAINGVTYTQLVLREVATGAEQVLVDERVLGSAVSSPEYAPDGTRVAFTANGAIQTIAVSGGRPQVVAASSTAKSGTSTWYGGAVWSPDSSALAVGTWTRDKFNVFTYYGAEVASTGGTVTNLTPRSPNSGPAAWR
jgi:hypothetical protein